jgi:uncharacterized protein (TIGR02266 family)
MGDSLERRGQTRVEVSIAVEVRDSSGGFTLHSTRDLSTGGVFFDRAIPLAEGAAVQLEFRLPGESAPIQCDGQVVNIPDTHGYGMGINFVFLKEADRARIETFIEQQSGGNR